MHHPDSTDRRLAELVAIRIVVTRLLFELAWQAGDQSEFLAREHQAAIRDLDSYNFPHARRKALE